jgi:transposase-like protein
MNKQFTDKQLMALELLTSGLGMRYKDIAAAVGVNQRTLYEWRHGPDYRHFQEELNRINEERWACITDVARASAMRLLLADNQRMTEFVLKNEGYNPAQKLEADIQTDISITIDE